MLSGIEFIKQSLGLHHFWRIMKEHSFFLEVTFSPRDASLPGTMLFAENLMHYLEKLFRFQTVL